MQRISIENLYKIYNSKHLLRTPRSIATSAIKNYSDQTTVKGPPQLEEKKWQASFYQKEKGKVAGKLPFKLKVEKGKTYSWCTCGHSKKQPLCDNTHRIDMLRIKLRPIFFKAPEDGDMWLCTCKQTNNRPFCDGSHKCKEVQETPNV